MSGHGYTKADERRLMAEVAATREAWTPAVGDRVTVAGTVQEIYADTALINLGDGLLAAAPVGLLRQADGDPV